MLTFAVADDVLHEHVLYLRFGGRRVYGFGFGAAPVIITG